VQIYYPADYGEGPRKLRENPEGYGFNITLSDGDITQFAQTAVPCFDYDGEDRWDKPCNEDGNTYSVQIYVKTGEPTITITITWQPPFAGRTATYTLDRNINIAKYYDANYHPDHISQKR
jgi:hypothetical protein